MGTLGPELAIDGSAGVPLRPPKAVFTNICGLRVVESGLIGVEPAQPEQRNPKQQSRYSNSYLFYYNCYHKDLTEQ